MQICIHKQLMIYTTMNEIEIPKKELKTKKLFVPVTPTEHEHILNVCREKQTTQTDLIRFALKQIKVL